MSSSFSYRPGMSLELAMKTPRPSDHEGSAPQRQIGSETTEAFPGKTEPVVPIGAIGSVREAEEASFGPFEIGMLRD